MWRIWENIIPGIKCMYGNNCVIIVIRNIAKECEKCTPSLIPGSIIKNPSCSIGPYCSVVKYHIIKCVIVK